MNRQFQSSNVGIIWLSLCLLTTTTVIADDKPLVKTTHVYKTVGDVKVEADVYRPEGAEARPVVVWIHGGALRAGWQILWHFRISVGVIGQSSHGFMNVERHAPDGDDLLRRLFWWKRRGT